MDPRDEKRVQDLEKKLLDLQTEFNSYVKKREEEEAKKLRMALLWAGALIIALGSFIWTELIWPILKSGGSK